MFSIKSILNENGIFVALEKFQEKYGNNKDYITYIGCAQAVKSDIRKTGLTVDNNCSDHVIKTFEVIYGRIYRQKEMRQNSIKNLLQLLLTEPPCHLTALISCLERGRPKLFVCGLTK